jgi:hypothetical protein
MSITRRGFSAGLAAGLLAGPFGRLLSGGARAQGAPRARRLLIFYSPNGTVHQFWRPQGGPRDFVLPAGGVLEPLAAHRDDLVFIDGLNFINADNHEPGQAAMLTNGGGANTPTRGMSVDQFLASRIGAEDRFPSLEFGVLTDLWGANTQTRMSYRGAGEHAHPDADPRRVFDRLFGDLVGGGDRHQALRRSILDTGHAELQDLHRRVGAVERAKLERHLTALRSVEQSLFAEVDCAAPEAPDRLNKDANDNAPALLAAQMDLAVTALACGLTRVASIQFSHTVSPVVFNWVGNTDAHHALSHAGNGQAAQLEQLVNAERWLAEQFARLITMLKATPDPEGGSLFDSTVVLWPKEMGDSRAHVCTDVPFVIGGGPIEGGRYLHLDGVSHGHLLVSICQAFGLENDTFGDPNVAQGGLAGLL